MKNHTTKRKKIDYQLASTSLFEMVGKMGSVSLFWTEVNRPDINKDVDLLQNQGNKKGFCNGI